MFYIYCYSDLKGIPFYIGKGCNDRFKYHLYESQNKKDGIYYNPRKSRKINKIVCQVGIDYFLKHHIKIIVDNLTEQESLAKEQEFILKYGRLDLGTGTLTNLTPRHSSNTLVGFSFRVLSWLLHHANREGRNEYLYKIKNRLLSKYGNFIGYDVQFIEGKKCNSCHGSGVYVHYSWYGNEKEYEHCYRCYDGWYKRPTWNVLQRIQFGNYVFHQPFERLYKKPEEISLPIIEGYIDHNRSKHGKFALTVLFLLYEKGYLKRWYKSAGIGWRCYWWQPRNWLYNIVHIIKHGRNSIPFNDTKAKMKAIIDKYKSVKPVSYEPDNLPF